ncbi:hypothetical protein [Streptomyces sp. SID12501]|uniref:hypothetical protein n=1 Tax=Streptomyces sp. SID12501 TaxID=2706042 RepID=UPI0031B9BB21
MTGSLCGSAGLALTFMGMVGWYWPVVVAGLYVVGALLTPPERPSLPDFSTQLTHLTDDFAELRKYLAEVDMPPAAAGRLAELIELLSALLDPGWIAELLAYDPDSVHLLSRVVRQEIPEAADAFVRTRWWNRLAPGTEPPERHLERQLSLLRDEADQVTASLRAAEAHRQESLTRYLKDRDQ